MSLNDHPLLLERVIKVSEELRFKNHNRLLQHLLDVYGIEGVLTTINEDGSNTVFLDDIIETAPTLNEALHLLLEDLEQRNG